MTRSTLAAGALLAVVGFSLFDYAVRSQPPELQAPAGPPLPSAPAAGASASASGQPARTDSDGLLGAPGTVGGVLAFLGTVVLAFVTYRFNKSLEAFKADQGRAI